MQEEVSEALRLGLLQDLAKCVTVMIHDRVGQSLDELLILRDLDDDFRELRKLVDRNGTLRPRPDKFGPEEDVLLRPKPAGLGLQQEPRLNWPRRNA